MKKLPKEDMNMKINRRKFIESTVCAIGGITIPGIVMANRKYKPIRFGIVTDIHYADVPDDKNLNRYYRESLSKVNECVELMNEQKVDFLIELGIFEGSGESSKRNSNLKIS